MDSTGGDAMAQPVASLPRVAQVLLLVLMVQLSPAALSRGHLPRRYE